MKAGQTPCQKYWHKLLDMVESGKLNPQVVISHEGPLDAAPHLYKLFNDKQEDCVKVIPEPAAGHCGCSRSHKHALFGYVYCVSV